MSKPPFAGQNHGKQIHELEDPVYCPDSPSHEHSWTTPNGKDDDMVPCICEYCGVIES